SLLNFSAHQATRRMPAICGLTEGISSSISRDTSTMVSGWWPFSKRAYLKAWARLTNRPPNMPCCWRATQLPRPFLPMKTTVEGVGLHEGGLTTFPFIVLRVRYVHATATTPSRSLLFETSSARSMLDLTAPNICAVEYEFDGEGMPIS